MTTATHDKTDDPTVPTVATDAQASSRLPYKSPRLRHLGSVRELTLGGTSGIVADGGGTMRQM